MGASSANNFPYNSDDPGDIATQGAFNTIGGVTASYLVKFNASGVRQWGTYIVGQRPAASVTGGLELVLDTNGDPYVAGGVRPGTNDVNFPANVGEGTTYTTGTNVGFLAKFASNSGARVWGRYFAGIIRGLQIDPVQNRLYAVGNTTSATGIASADAYRPALATTDDGFYASFDLGGHFLYGTYMGTVSGTSAAINGRLDQEGNLIIFGITTTTGSELTTDCSYQPVPGGNRDVFINKFNIATKQKVWGSYYGGLLADGPGTGGFIGSPYATKNLALLPNGSVAIGYTQTGLTGLAMPAASHQSAYAGGTSDGMLLKFNSSGIPADLTVSAGVLLPATQTACILGIPGLITGNAVGVTSPSTFTGKVLYQWQKANSVTGPWEDMPGEVFKDLQPLASQTTIYYRRQVKFCDQEIIDVSPVASVVIGSSIAPVANANGPQWFVCGPGSNTVPLTGSATGGTGAYNYRWYSGSTSSGTLVASAAAFTIPAITSATTYTLQVTDAAGCTDIDQVTVVPAIANAGSSKSFCQGSSGVQIGTAPIASPSISYAWSIQPGGTANSLSCTNCAQPIATPAAVTTYLLTVTVIRKDGSTCSSTSNVTVTPVLPPGGNATTFAGSDKTICSNESVVLGGTDASFNYTWTPGQFLNNSQMANPTFAAGTDFVRNGVADYTVNAEKAGCVFTDQVRVSVINPHITNENETVCPGWSRYLGEVNAPQAVYTWTVVNGTGSVLQTSNNGTDAYLDSPMGVSTRFRRTVTLNGKSCSADIIIFTAPVCICNFEISVSSLQQCAKVFPNADSRYRELRLRTTLSDTANYNFSWSPANLVDNPTSPSVLITSATQATMTVTITNKYNASISCSESIVINRPEWSLPEFNASDVYTCPNTPVQIGLAPLSGFSYNWEDVVPELSNPKIANPFATVPTNRNFGVDITETASGCRLRENVLVNVSSPIADAGKDRAVCNGATVTLGTPTLAGTNWTYAWTPANASWTNGTGASSPQPQLQFAFTTPQTYTLTVTDPLSGCTATDQVVLSNTVTPGEYAGSAQTTCQGAPVQLGRQAEPLAQSNGLRQQV